MKLNHRDLLKVSVGITGLILLYTPEKVSTSDSPNKSDKAVLIDGTNLLAAGGAMLPVSMPTIEPSYPSGAGSYCQHDMVRQAGRRKSQSYQWSFKRVTGRCQRSTEKKTREA